MTDRCEPPEGLRDKPGYHWLRRADTEGRTPPTIWTWRTPERVWRSRGIERTPDDMHHHYVAPVPNHDVVAALVEALRECADDLEAEVNDRYPPSQMAAYPDQQRKRERDMQPVAEARAALARYHAAANPDSTPG